MTQHARLTLTVDDLPNGEQMGVVTHDDEVVSVQIKPPDHLCSRCGRTIGLRVQCAGTIDGLVCRRCWDGTASPGLKSPLNGP